MVTIDERARTGSRGFRHEALLYASDDEFLQGTAPFIAEGIAAHESVLVVVAQPKIDRLRAALGSLTGDVRFADMTEVGRNPSTLIPLWRDFVSEHGDRGRSVRGIGEPISTMRTSDELAECETHEALLNIAFSPAENFWLLCPYDAHELSPRVLEESARNHASLLSRGETTLSTTYRGGPDVAGGFGTPLSPVPHDARRLPFSAPVDLRVLREVVTDRGRALGLSVGCADDLALAADEVAANGLEHGGGDGAVEIWAHGERVLCQITGGGSIDDPLVGRVRPPPEAGAGFGLWLANQLCDLVQIRTTDPGVTVRLQMRLDGS